MTNHILKHEGKLLQNILNKVNVLQELNQQFSQHIDPNLAKHCHIAKIENNRLIVIVDNGNWATQLRFYIPELLAKLRTFPAMKNLQAICSKIRPDYKPVKATRSPRAAMRLSSETAKIVLKTAENIKDPTLQAILTRIANYCS